MLSLYSPETFDPTQRPMAGTPLNPYWEAEYQPALLLPCWEGAGGALEDVSSAGASCTLNGGITWAARGDGPCLNFSAAGAAKVTCPAISGLTNQLTLRARVRPNSVSSFGTLIENDAGSGAKGFFLRISNTGKIDAFVHNGSIQELTGATPLEAGQDYDLAATYDGAALRVYVNGQLDGSKAVTGNITASASPLLLGNFAAGFVFDGLLRDAMVLKTAITDQQAASLYAGPSAMFAPLPNLPFTLQTASGDLLLKRRRAAA